MEVNKSFEVTLKKLFYLIFNCLYPFQKGEIIFFRASKWTVYLGAHRVHAAVEEGRLVEIVYEIIIHELYSPASLNHNIALLKFTYPLLYTGTVFQIESLLP